MFLTDTSMAWEQAPTAAVMQTVAAAEAEAASGAVWFVPPVGWSIISDIDDTVP